jgi:hypothetical protein
MENKNSDLRALLINIAKQYTTRVLASVSDDMEVNVYISGSVSYGFCDTLSDIEMEFYFPIGITPKVIKEVEKAIEAVPVFLDVRMSAGISKWPLENILHGDIEIFWSNFNPYTLYELNTALPIREDVPLIEKVKEKISFYPNNVANRVVRGLWLTVIDSGIYNADYSNKRNEFFISNLFFFRAMEALLRLAYMANKKYYPHTKWLSKGISALPEDFGLADFINHHETPTLDERIAKLNEIAFKIATQLVEKGMLESKYKDNAWDIMGDNYYLFNTF